MTRRLVPLVPAPDDAPGRRMHAERDGYLYTPRLLRESTLAPLGALVAAALTRRGWLRDATSDPVLRLGRWDDARWIDFLGEVLPSEPYRARSRRRPSSSACCAMCWAASPSRSSATSAGWSRRGRRS